MTALAELLKSHELLCGGLVLFLAFFYLFIFAMCKAAARGDRLMEEQRKRRLP